ncbi:hypothetical protein L1987_28775 [Smallanthus sonchifolius]|uniref:Uncharacterized protein n=1 Tax=Smallanthus sonchifolius TaxID=185202 RepID=A0ACB9HZM5_9ASTR|nr:hypothetical protein L1987_28775 [Smallanthus sonchifolius]
MCSLEKRGNLFVLTLTGDGVEEHRLNPTLISSIRSALFDAKKHSNPGSVFITISQGKFFCNGFDLKPTSHPSTAAETVLQLTEISKRLLADFISLPMPTIAVVTGHAVGAGVGLAMCHDYVFMRRDRGVLYMNEIHTGIPVPDYAVELIRSKVGKPQWVRDVLLRGVKVKADVGMKMGLVDVACDDQESAVEGGVRMGVELGKMKWDGELYAEMRKSLYPVLCSMLGLGLKLESRL